MGYVSLRYKFQPTILVRLARRYTYQELSLNIWEVDKLILFIAFIIPGFVSIKSYELIHPNDDKDSSKRIIEAIAYSCMNYAFLGIPLYYLLKPDMLESLVAIWFISVFSLVIFPALLTLLFSWLRRLDIVQRNTPHPIKRPWDYVFQQRQWYWVIVELNDDKRIAGKYASDSFSSSYPAAEQIYLEECWHLADDDSFDKPRGGTAGILIASSQIKTIEFFIYDNGDSENEQE
ncbi:MAG: hypothetical protein ACJAYB_001347 [Psychromonas sp.]